MNTCPHCNSRINPEAPRCPNCHKPLDPVPQMPTKRDATIIFIMVLIASVLGLVTMFLLSIQFDN